MPGPGRLTLADREEITLGLHAGESFTAIAARLGKAVSTVSREVAANGGRSGYRAWRAHRRAREQARRPKIPKLACPALAAQVMAWLAEWWSPVQVLSQAQRGQLAADLKTDASTRTIPADEWVLNEISAHVRRFGTGPGEVIVTNRLGKVARRNSFGGRWRLAVADARTCGKPSAPAFEGGQCCQTCADAAQGRNQEAR